MAEAEETKAKVSLSVLCPLCSDLFEVHDPRLVLLAGHLGEHCEETRGILHD